MRIVRPVVIREQSRLHAHLVQVRHLVQEGVGPGLEEAERLPRLAPGVVSAARVPLQLFGHQGVLGAVVGEELGAEADHRGEGIGGWLGVREGE